MKFDVYSLKNEIWIDEEKDRISVGFKSPNKIHLLIGTKSEEFSFKEIEELFDKIKEMREILIRG